MIKMGYYTSAAFYQRGIKALCGEAPAYVWLVQEQDPPFLCSLVGLDPHGADLGARKIESGLAIWRACELAGQWPAYPTRVCYPEIPQWEDSAWQKREEQELGKEYDIERFGWSKQEIEK